MTKMARAASTREEASDVVMQGFYTRVGLRSWAERILLSVRVELLGAGNFDRLWIPHSQSPELSGF